MNNSFSSRQVSKTGNLVSNLISRHYKLSLLAKFMPIEFEIRKLKQSKLADQLGYSSSTLQRYRNVINIHSLYKIQPNNTNKRSKTVSITTHDNKSHRENDLKRPEMTSK